MSNDESTKDPDDGLKVDQQDGGPGSHTESETGGDSNDVASGGSDE